MTKVKLTKNELKIQRDALKCFERYLPTLQLKKQQLQAEVSLIRESLADLDRQLQTMDFSSLEILTYTAVHLLQTVPTV